MFEEHTFSAAHDASDDPVDVISAEEYLSQDPPNVFLAPSGTSFIVRVQKSGHEQPLVHGHFGRTNVDS